jgi:Ca-activated chloride channel family protein
MVPTAHRVRTSLAIGAAGAAILLAVLLGQRHGDAPPACELPASGGIGLDARMVSDHMLAGGAQDLAVWIHAPGQTADHRAPVSLAIVIDRSGSMTGEPIANARAAAAHLIDQLTEADAFAVVAYSSDEQTMVPVTRATDAAKRAAHARLEQIYADGGTCISCGLLAGQAELASSPIAGLRRIVLISDGQANEGIADRGQLAELAAQTAARGTSISAVGVGLDFDEQTMTRLAEVGQGNYYFIEDTRNLDAMFARELGGLVQTVATGVRLDVSPAPGVTIDEVYGYPSTRQGGDVVVPVADLRAGETRKVVLHVTVAPGATGHAVIANLALAWTLTVKTDVPVRERVAVATTITNDPAAVTAGVDPAAAQAAAEAHSSSVLEQATAVYENRDTAAAVQIIRDQVQAVRADKNLPPATKQAIEQTYTETLDDFAATPADGQPAAKPMKKAREHAYKLAR